MGPIDPNKTGLALGALLGAWHLLWSLLVAAGWAQPALDFLFWLHRIEPAWRVQPFRISLAAILVGVTCVIGYVLGSSFAALWNALRRGPR